MTPPSLSIIATLKITRAGPLCNKNISRDVKKGVDSRSPNTMVDNIDVYAESIVLIPIQTKGNLCNPNMIHKDG